jgi:tripeptidyl-peptidase-1
MPNFSDLSSLAHCDELITPACVKALYDIPPATKANPGNAMGIFEEGDFYDQEDLNLFFQKYTPYIPQGTHPTPNFVDGAEAPVNVSEGGGESTLDFELAYPLLYPQKLVLYQTDDINYATENPTEGAFNTFLDAIDGASTSNILIVCKTLTCASHIVHTQHTARLVMIQFSTRYTLIPLPMGIKES